MQVVPPSNLNKPNKVSNIEFKDCVICLTSDRSIQKYFECNKYSHDICKECFKKLRIMSSINSTKLVCPLCRATVLNEAKDINQLNDQEIYALDVSKIPLLQIYILQSFHLSEIRNMIPVNNNQIMFYTGIDGNFIRFKDSFICANGFLYKYNEKKIYTNLK